MSFLDTLDQWSKEDADGKSFDERFEFADAPLSWFVEKLFYPESVPLLINPYPRLKAGKTLGIYSAVHSVLRFVLQKALVRRELQKFRVHRTVVSAHSHVMFLAFSNQLKDGKISRIQSVVDLVKPFVVYVDPLSRNEHAKLSGLSTLYSYADEQMIDDARREAGVLYNQVKNFDAAPAFGEYWNHLKHLYRFYFSEDFLFLLVLYFKTSVALLTREKIRCVVLTSPHSLFERCMIAAAHSLKVKVLVLQHGMGLANRPLHDPYGCYFAVFGDFHKKRLIAQGIHKEKIFVVGPTVYQGVEKYIGVKKKKSVLFTTQALIEVGLITKHDYFRYLEQMLDALRSISDVTIEIKLHPREIYVAEYEKLLKKYSNVVLYAGSSNLYQVMSTAGVMINFYGSSTILEASILDVPSVTAEFPALTQTYFASYDPSVRVAYTDVRAAVVSALEHPARGRALRKKLVDDWCGPVDGQAHERVAEIVKVLGK